MRIQSRLNSQTSFEEKENELDYSTEFQVLSGVLHLRLLPRVIWQRLSLSKVLNGISVTFGNAPRVKVRWCKQVADGINCIWWFLTRCIVPKIETMIHHGRQKVDKRIDKYTRSGTSC